MRVLMVADSLAMGGAERHVIGLAAALRGCGDDAVVAVSAGGPLAGAAHRASVPVRIVSPVAAKREVSLPFAVGVQRQVRRWRPDVVHAHMFSSAVAATLALHGSAIPLVITEHSEGVWQRDEDVRVSRLCHAAASAVITVSDALRDRLHRGGVHPDRLVSVPNALIALPTASPGPEGPSLGDGQGIVVAVLARLRPEKGLVPFLHAAALVAASRADVRFVIAGEGPQRDELARLADTLAISDRVDFLGVCGDAAALMAAVDLVVLPSLSNEGTPLVILEAMHAARPIVATVVGGIPELVRHGREAMLVPPGDHGALADAILALLAQPRMAHQLGHRARFRARRRFSLERMLAQTRAVYGSVIPDAVDQPTVG